MSRRHRGDEAGQRVGVDDGADVGLFGLQTKISRVRSVIAASIASRSKVWSVSGTCTGVAPGGADLQRVDLEAAPAEQHLVADGGR